MHLGHILFVANISIALTGCATSPRPGEIAHTRVITVVSDWLYQKAYSKDQAEEINNPHRTHAIQVAINAGVSIDDVRDKRLVLSSCRYGSNSGMMFITLLPKGVELPQGDRVELEIEAGAYSYRGIPRALSQFRRILPERPQGRTDCYPDNG